MFGPLFVLKWKGTICPCLESSSEREARNALELLQNLPILWDRNGASEGGASGLVGKLFSSSKKKTGIPSTLCFIDGNDGPIIQVEPQPQQSDTGLDDNDSSPLQQSAGYIKTLPLFEVKVVECKDDSTINLGTRIGGKPKKLLTFQVVQHEESYSPETIQQALLKLVDWEQSRLSEDERPLDLEMNRAQKAAHFVEREIELKRKKSERDKRKSKYMNMSRKGGGGMKYTAIAMANRADNSNSIT